MGVFQSALVALRDSALVGVLRSALAALRDSPLVGILLLDKQRLTAKARISGV
jgi:hypothetical protein